MPAASYEFFSDFVDFLMWCPLSGTEQRLNHTVEFGEDFRSDARRQAFRPAGKGGPEGPHFWSLRTYCTLTTRMTGDIMNFPFLLPLPLPFPLPLPV